MAEVCRTGVSVMKLRCRRFGAAVALVHGTGVAADVAAAAGKGHMGERRWIGELS